jgi:pSer/pThr/pTyr-binding forkhead associated (FHA) protein
MHDGNTRKQKRPAPPVPAPAFLDTHRICLVIVEGAMAGSEFALDGARHVIGRGDSASIQIQDDALSREHAAFEAIDEAIRVRDLGSTNGVHVNGTATLAGELKHGDRIEIGSQVFQLLIESRERGPRTFVLPED